MGLLDVLNGMQNGPHGPSHPSTQSNSGMSPMTMAILALLAWKAVGCFTYAGYIIGFPNDTPESIVRDIKIIQRELPLDLLEFFFLTPLPGSEDHKKLWTAGVPMDPDMNRYDLEHACTAHPKMSKEEWERT